MDKRYVILMVASVILIASAGCVGIFSHEAPAPADCVFIEHNDTVAESLVDRNLSGYPMIHVTDPFGNGYEFNESARTLFYCMDFGLADRTVAVLGDAKGSQGLECTVTYGLYAMNETPGYAGGIQILKVYENGTVLLSYGNRTFSLVPGEEWKNETSSIRCENMTIYDYNTSKGSVIPVTINTTRVDSIRNRGIIKKVDIHSGLGMI